MVEEGKSRGCLLLMDIDIRYRSSSRRKKTNMGRHTHTHTCSAVSQPSQAGGFLCALPVLLAVLGAELRHVCVRVQEVSRFRVQELGLGWRVQ